MPTWRFLNREINVVSAGSARAPRNYRVGLANGQRPGKEKAALGVFLLQFFQECGVINLNPDRIALGNDVLVRVING